MVVYIYAPSDRKIQWLSIHQKTPKKPFALARSLMIPGRAAMIQQGKKRWKLDLVSHLLRCYTLYFPLTASGPDLCAFGLARARQGAWHVKNTNYLGAHGPHFGTPDSHLQLLDVAIKFIPVLAGTPLLQRYGRPTLWHTDLHMGNIFVSEKDLTKVVGVIDWQFVSILPGFIQARWPEFLTPPEGYETGPIEPQIPTDFQEMDPDEQAYAVLQKDQALQAKCYEVALSRCHRDSYLALTGIHDTIRRLFFLCERTYKDGIVPLRDCLIELSSNWERIGLTGSPPLTLSKEELATHEIQLTEYQDWVKLRKYTQEILCSDDDGWVSPELDFNKVQAQEKELFELYLQRQAPETSAEKARELWFYHQRRP